MILILTRGLARGHMDTENSEAASTNPDNSEMAEDYYTTTVVHSEKQYTVRVHSLQATSRLQ